MNDLVQDANDVRQDLDEENLLEKPGFGLLWYLLMIPRLPGFLLVEFPMLIPNYFVGARVTDDGHGDTVTVYEISLLIYALPFAWTGLLLCGLSWLGVPSAPLGFAVLLGGPLLAVVLGADPNRDRVIIIVASLVLLLLSFGVVDLGLFALKTSGSIDWSFGIYQSIYDWLMYVDFEFPRNLLMTWAVSAFLVSMVLVIHARFERKFLISTRSVDHYRWGRSDGGEQRSGTTMIIDWRDAIEYYLGFGSGDVLLKKSSLEVVRVRNCLGLKSVEERLNRLNQTYGTTEAAIAEHEN